MTDNEVHGFLVTMVMVALVSCLATCSLYSCDDVQYVQRSLHRCIVRAPGVCKSTSIRAVDPATSGSLCKCTTIDGVLRYEAKSSR